MDDTAKILQNYDYFSFLIFFKGNEAVCAWC